MDDLAFDNLSNIMNMDLASKTKHRTDFYELFKMALPNLLTKTNYTWCIIYLFIYLLFIRIKIYSQIYIHTLLLNAA